MTLKNILRAEVSCKRCLDASGKHLDIRCLAFKNFLLGRDLVFIAEFQQDELELAAIEAAKKRLNDSVRGMKKSGS